MPRTTSIWFCFTNYCTTVKWCLQCSQCSAFPSFVCNQHVPFMIVVIHRQHNFPLGSLQARLVMTETFPVSRERTKPSIRSVQDATTLRKVLSYFSSHLIYNIHHSLVCHLGAAGIIVQLLLAHIFWEDYATNVLKGWGTIPHGWEKGSNAWQKGKKCSTCLNCSPVAQM